MYIIVWLHINSMVILHFLELNFIQMNNVFIYRNNQLKNKVMFGAAYHRKILHCPDFSTILFMYRTSCNAVWFWVPQRTQTFRHISVADEIDRKRKHASKLDTKTLPRLFATSSRWNPQCILKWCCWLESLSCCNEVKFCCSKISF